MQTNVGFLFDLDGVLIDSETEYTRIWETIERSFPTGISDFARVIKGQTLDKILQENFPEVTVREQVTAMLYELEAKMRYRYCPGAEEFIKKIIDRGIPRAVVTSSNDYKMRHLYDDIPDFKANFPIIIDSSNVKRSKPDPEGYLLGARKIGIPIANCAVFEDSVQGVKAGRNAGAFVVGIVGTKTREELFNYCDILIDNLSEIDIDSLVKTLSE